jgi:Bacterial archaeo-eukaryotic release factor family 10
MAPPAVGTGTLRRLSELKTGCHPVLSVYLGLECTRSTSAAARERELDALMTDLDRWAVEADVDRLREMLRCMPAFAYGTRSLAMFSSAEGTAFAAVPLPSPVESTAVVDTLPWLEPLAGIFTPGDHAVAVIDRRTARLFRGAPRMLVEFATLHDERHCKPTLGDCTKPARRGPTDERLAEHTRHLAALLLHAHRRRAFDELTVIAPSELWPAIEAVLHIDLRGRLSRLVELELMDAPAHEIARRVAQCAQRELTDHCGCSNGTGLPVPVTIGITNNADALALV